MKNRFLALLGFAPLVAGCAGFQAVDSTKPVNVGDDISVDSQVAWSRLNAAAKVGTVWTIDGLGLDELRFYTGIEPGSPLTRIDGVQVKDMAEYKAAMLPDDVMDLLSSTLAKAGYQQVRTSGLHPQPFGSVTGFRFDVAFLTKDGLQMKGTALIAQRRHKLDVILFVAPAEYYFDHYLPTVERILSTIRIPDKPEAQTG